MASACTYRIFPAIRPGFRPSRMTSNNLISPMKFCYKTNSTLPKQCQSSRSVLQDGSRTFGLFWKEKTPSYNRRNTVKRQSHLQQTTFIDIFSLFFRDNTRYKIQESLLRIFGPHRSTYRHIRLDVSSESSTSQRIHMKNLALFSLKDKSETKK